MTRQDATGLLLCALAFCCGCATEERVLVDGHWMKPGAIAAKLDAIEAKLHQIEKRLTQTELALGRTIETDAQRIDHLERILANLQSPPLPTSDPDDPDEQGSFEKRDRKLYLVPSPAAQRRNAQRRNAQTIWRPQAPLAPIINDSGQVIQPEPK